MAALAEGGQDHGALVQQILETQKELEDVNKRQQHKTAIEIVSNFFILLFFAQSMHFKLALPQAAQLSIFL